MIKYILRVFSCRKRPGGCRRGYMGHLVKIVNSVSSQCEKGPLEDFLKQNLPEEVLSSWFSFIDLSIEPINAIYETCLVSIHFF